MVQFAVAHRSGFSNEQDLLFFMVVDSNHDLVMMLEHPPHMEIVQIQREAVNLMRRAMRILRESFPLDRHLMNAAGLIEVLKEKI